MADECVRLRSKLASSLSQIQIYQSVVQEQGKGLEARHTPAELQPPAADDTKRQLKLAQLELARLRQDKSQQVRSVSMMSASTAVKYNILSCLQRTTHCGVDCGSRQGRIWQQR